MTPRPLHIAFVGAVVPDVPEFRTTAFNRAGNHFQVQLISALREAGCEVSLVLSQMPRRAAPRSNVFLQRAMRVGVAPGLDARLVPFVNVPLIRIATVGAGLLPQLLLWAWRHRSVRRVMLVYNLTEPPGAAVLAAARLTGSKAVASVQDIWLPGESAPDTWRYRADYTLHRALLPRFDALFVASERTRDDLAPRVPSVCIEGGVTADQLAVEPKARGHRPFTLVATGTLNYINGIRLILDAFARLCGKTYRLRLAGEGPMAADVRAAAAVDPRIEYFGYLDRAACLELQADADVLLNIRLTESVRTEYFFPSKLIEYLASGVPAISTLNQHTRSTWEPFVYPLVDERPEALADLIGQVASLPAEARRDRAVAARRFVAREWSWKRQGEKAAALLHRISDR